LSFWDTYLGLRFEFEVWVNRFLDLISRFTFGV